MFRNRTVDHIIVMELISKPGEAVYLDIDDEKDKGAGAVETVKVHEIVRSKPKPGKKPAKAKNAKIDKVSIINKRSRFCACGCKQSGHHLHHCLIGRKKGYEILDDERNLVFVNGDEHLKRKFDNVKWRSFFWLVQVRLYGLPAMLEWIEIVRASGLSESRLDFLR